MSAADMRALQRQGGGNTLHVCFGVVKGTARCVVRCTKRRKNSSNIITHAMKSLFIKKKNEAIGTSRLCIGCAPALAEHLTLKFGICAMVFC